jgi:hypothetical protein
MWTLQCSYENLAAQNLSAFWSAAGVLMDHVNMRAKAVTGAARRGSRAGMSASLADISRKFTP